MNLGIVGLGEQLCRRHLPALANLQIVPVAVYDPDSAAVDRFKLKFQELFPNQNIPTVAENLHKLARQVDVVDVVIPPDAHLTVFSALIQERTMFLCEKPFCRSWPEAVHVAKQASSAGVAAGYLENWIFDPVVIDLEAVIYSGEIGTLQRISIQFPNAGLSIYPKQSPWRAQAGKGGALLDWGSHAAGLAWHLAGEDSEFLSAYAIDIRASRHRSLVSGAFRDVEVEDIARFELIFERPEGRTILANIDSSWHPPWMWSPGYSYRVLRVDASKGAADISVENTPEGRRYQLAIENLNGHRQEIDLGLLKRYDPTACAIENALKSLRDESLPHPESNLDFGVTVQLMLGTALLSAAQGQSVKADEFVAWCHKFTSEVSSPDEAWNNALVTLRTDTNDTFSRKL